MRYLIDVAAPIAAGAAKESKGLSHKAHQWKGFGASCREKRLVPADDSAAVKTKSDEKKQRGDFVA